jgi:hypothetical protein
LYGSSVVKTFDEGYAFTGGWGDDLEPVMYLAKTDRSGNLLWTKTFASTSIDSTQPGRWLRQSSDSGFVLIGTIGYYGEFNTLVIKTDKNGVVQWQKELTGIRGGSSIAIADDNGYTGIGYVSDTSEHVAVFKLNTGGTLIWSKQYAYAHSTRGNSIERTSDNGFIITGQVEKTSTDYDVYLLKIDAQGTVKWQNSYGCPYNDIGYHGIETSDGGYIAVGQNAKDADSRTMQIYLVKVDAQGKYKWNKGYFPSTHSGWGFKVHQTSDGSYTLSAFPYGKAALIKVGATGSYQWKKEYPAVVIEQIFDFFVESDGGYVLTGKSNDPEVYPNQAALLKTDSNGNY